MATPNSLVGDSASRSLTAGNCALCLLPLDLPYGAVVELVENSTTMRNSYLRVASAVRPRLVPVRDEALLDGYGDRSRLSFVCRIEIAQ